MLDYKLHDELKILSMGVYKKNRNKLPNDWIALKEYKNNKTGFYGQAFYKNRKLAIVFRGTDDLNDLLFQDSMMAIIKKIPFQYTDAQKFYEEFKDFPCNEIIFSGHSLGGSISQLMSNKTGCKAVTFNAYGTANLLNEAINKNYYNNIINYGNKNDPIFLSNIDNQLGKTYIIGLNNLENTQNNYTIKEIKTGKININNMNFNKHKIENMGDIRKSVEYDSEVQKELKPVVLKARVEYNVDQCKVKCHIKNIQKMKRLLWHS